MPRWIWTLKEAASDRADRAIAEAFHQDLGEWAEDLELPAPSRSRIQTLLNEGKVLFNGKPGLAREKLAAGTLVSIDFPDPIPMEIQPEAIPLEFLFQDEHIAVINKPAGLTVHPSSTQATGTLVHALLYHLKDLSGVGGVQRPGIVHRLDKDTSGALVIAKSDLAHRKLVEIFTAHQIERRYWALCYGVPKRTGKIATLIARNPNDRLKMSCEVTEGREAITQVQVLQKFGHSGQAPFASWIEAQLETGRTHQVRVHLTHLDSSLLGDPLYGKPMAQQPKWKALPKEVQAGIEKLPGQALHARVLGFAHPISGVPLRFEANPPPAFQALEKTLENFRA